MRFYDPRFGRFTSPDPDHTIMSPYTYVLNNPVSFTDPTGHAAKCGGAYQPNFNTRMWRMVAFGSYLWRTWPMPHQLGPGERSENGLTYVLNLVFVDASGGDPFRNWWEDRDLTPEQLEKVETAYKLLKLWKEKWNPAPERAIGAEAKGWIPQYPDPWHITFSALNEDQLTEIISVMNELLEKAVVIEGTVATGTDINGNPILERVTLAEVLIKVLESSNEFSIMGLGYTLGMNLAGGAAPPVLGYGHMIGDCAVIAMRYDQFASYWNSKDPPISLLGAGVDPLQTFLEELFHIYGGPSSPYSREYTGGRDPATDIQNGGWMDPRFRPSPWR